MKQTQPKISIIVPVYNAKQYLRQCVESILNWNTTTPPQPPFPGEILLVDNGSTDGSLQLAQDLAKPHKHIQVLNCPTPGAAAARNFGLKHAQGNWVWFIDSDDFVAPGAITKLLRCINQKPEADLITIAMQKVSADGRQKQGLLPAVQGGLDDPSLDFHTWASTFIRYGLGPVQVPARRNFLLRHRLFYDEGIIHEDMAIISSYILHTDRVASLQEPIYFYRQRQNSVIHQTVWDKKELDIFKALELLSHRFEQAGRYEEFKTELEYFYIWNLLDDAAHQFHKFPEGRKHFAQIRTALSSRFPHWRQNPYFCNCPLITQINCRLAYHGIIR